MGYGGSGSGYRRVGDDRTANIKVNNITNRDGSSGTDVDGIVKVNSTSHFVPPSGRTGERYVDLKSDPYYEFLELCLPFTENTIFLDVTGNFGNPRKIGDVTMSSNESKFYSQSVLFDNSGDGLNYGGSKNQLQGDFTIESWIYRTSTGNTDNIFADYYFNSTQHNGDVQVYIANDKFGWWWKQNNTTYSKVGSTIVNANSWYHVSLTRKNGVVKGWLNGNLEFTDERVFASLPFGDITRGWWIGIDSNDSAEPFGGYMQDFRLYNGVSKYNDTFTPPSKIGL